jgi:hypothetical protein
LLAIPNDTTLLCQIHEDLKDLLIIGNQSQIKSHGQIQDFCSDHAKFEFQNGLLYRDGLLYVSNGLAQFQILQLKHDTLVVGHFGFNKTMELMSRNYWWPQLWKYVKDFIRSCDVYVQIKNSCHHLHGFFRSLHTCGLQFPWISL